MPDWHCFRQTIRSPRAALILGLSWLLAACASVPNPHVPVEDRASVTNEPPPSAVRQAAPTSPAPVAQRPRATESTRQPARAVEKAVEPPRKTVENPEPIVQDDDVAPSIAVVLSSSNSAYRSVAAELSALLGTYEIYDLSEASRTPDALMREIGATGADAIIAIGLDAARAARDHADIPTVFCQVFNYESNDLLSTRVSGVSATPPLDALIRAWKERSPGLEDIGAVLGAGHAHLIEEAQAAAAANGVRLHVRNARSDRETLYQFNGLLPEVDGFWLFPDNRILSLSVLREMLDYATRHDVEVAVFNDSLLRFGASLSVSSVDADVARTVVSVVERVLASDGKAVAGIVPLSQIEVAQ